MYMDTVVIAGIVTVLLMIAFFVGFAVFVMKDNKAHGDKATKTNQGGKGH